MNNNDTKIDHRSMLSGVRAAFASSLFSGKVKGANDRFNRRTGDVQLTGSYTWSKALSDSSGLSDNPENYEDRHFSYGPATFDRRHIFVATAFHIPFGKGWNGPAKYLFAGWSLSGINRFQPAHTTPQPELLRLVRAAPTTAEARFHCRPMRNSSGSRFIAFIKDPNNCPLSKAFSMTPEGADVRYLYNTPSPPLLAG